MLSMLSAQSGPDSAARIEGTCRQHSGAAAARQLSNYLSFWRRLEWWSLLYKSESSVPKHPNIQIHFSVSERFRGFYKVKFHIFI